jgi:hypothetical protein
MLGERAPTSARDSGDGDVAAVVFHDLRGGSRRPGAIFEMKNRDGDIAIHLTFSPTD